MNSADLLRTLRAFIEDRFHLGEDRLPEEEVGVAIRKGIEFRGLNVWVLVCAIMIASIGLNMNSTAVIIGAMLISPLMGPIMGVGLAVGILDWTLFKKAGRNFAVMVGVSLVTATLYFLLSPISQARSELLARTTPTIWDVLIALFGGMAGIVAAASRERGNVLPGVAIATALMPPLCTAGYGLATAQWTYLAGALYLFLINTVFISLGTLAVVRVLRFSHVSFSDPALLIHVRRIILLVVVATVGPSLYLAWGMVRQSVLEQNLQSFLRKEFRFAEARVLSWELDRPTRPTRLDLYMIGTPLDDEVVAMLQARRADYRLQDVELVLHQDQPGSWAEADGRRADLLEDLYRRRESELGDLGQRARQLEARLQFWHLDEARLDKLAREARAVFPDLGEIAAAPAILHGEAVGDTVLLVLARGKKTLRQDTRNRLEAWLGERYDQRRVVLLPER
jgi:uncharacterized hydrophobic protein (TIGR00271 family)